MKRGRCDETVCYQTFKGLTNIKMMSPHMPLFKTNLNDQRRRGLNHLAQETQRHSHPCLCKVP